MSPPITATELRGNIYRILDEILATGEAREVSRRGARLLILPVAPRARNLADLPRRRALNCTADELVATSWEDAWRPEP